MNRKIFLTCLTVLGIFTAAESQTAKWQQDPITIDGVADDWGGPIRFYNSDSKINYEFRNDAQNLYLIVKTSDQMMQRQLMIAGFKLKFKTKSEPTINATIAFAGLSGKNMPRPDKDKMKQRTNRDAQNMNSEMPENPDMSANPDEMQLPPMPSHKDTVKLDGFLYAPREITVGNNGASEGICIAKTGFERAKEIAYEFKIPIREFAGDNYNLEKFADTQIQLQILIDAPSGNRSGGGRSGMSMHGGGMGGPGGGMGGPGGGMGGGPGGGGGDMGGGPGGDDMGGGMGQGPGDEMGQGSSMSAKKISAKFTLATKPQ